MNFIAENEYEIRDIQGGVTAPTGFKAAGIHCGIRKNRSKKDLSLIYSEAVCNAAAIYTKNIVKGAPIKVCMEHLENGKAQAIICNSGIANTCSPDGEEKAVLMSRLAASSLSIPEENVLVASTGVIGPSLDLNPVEKALPSLVGMLSSNAGGSRSAAEAIMTTDTVPKERAVVFKISGKECKIGGIAKGSGMICPNMATMLSFITTDVNITGEMLKSALVEAASTTFNMLSIDGDTSTNDMLVILAGGKAENEIISDKNESYIVFRSALERLFTELCLMLAKDGEGATKLLLCEVEGARDTETARMAAKAVVSSNLLKTAIFGADANWGRALCALGYSGGDFDPSAVELCFQSDAGKIKVCSHGAGLDFSEPEAKKILSEDEILISVKLGDGDGRALAFGCDLSYDYVRINGDYRS